MSTVSRQARRTLAVVTLSVGLVILAVSTVATVAYPALVVVLFGHPAGYWRGVLLGAVGGAGLLVVGVSLLLWDRRDARGTERSPDGDE